MGCCNNRCRCDNSWWNNNWWFYCCPCFNAQYVISGNVIGVDGNGTGGVTISYTVNGQPSTVLTDTNGNYSFTVPANAAVTIQAIPAIGVVAIPTMYNLTSVNGNISGLDFTLTVV